MLRVAPGTKAPKSVALHNRSSPRPQKLCSTGSAGGGRGRGGVRAGGSRAPPSSAAHPAPSRPGNVRQQYVGPPEAQQGAQVQAPCHGEQPRAGGSHSGLHEPAGNDLQHVRPHAQAEVVCLDCGLLFLH